MYIEGGNSVCIFLFNGLSLFLPSDKAQCKIIFRLFFCTFRGHLHIFNMHNMSSGMKKC